MGNVFKSATKITLLLFAITACVTTTYIVARNFGDKDVITAMIGVFNMGIGLVFGFYFRNSTTNSEQEDKNLSSKK